MGWKLTGNASGVDAEVDATYKALRVSVRPVDATAWLSLAVKTGAMTGIAANAAIFSLRQIASTLLLVRRVGMGFVTTTAFTAGQVVDWGLMVARSFTVSDTSGTAVTLTGNNAKHRTSMVALTSVDCRVSAAAAVTAGTKTLDTNHIGMVGMFSGAVGAALAPAAGNLFGHDPEDQPLVLAQNEGLNVMNLTLMGAAGVGSGYIQAEITEIAAY